MKWKPHRMVDKVNNRIPNYSVLVILWIFRTIERIFRLLLWPVMKVIILIKFIQRFVFRSSHIERVGGLNLKDQPKKITKKRS